MKKKLAFLIAAMMTAAAIGGCGSSSTTDTTSTGTDSKAAESAAGASSIVESVESASMAEVIGSNADYRFLEEDLGVESYAIGFRVGDTELADLVSKTVQALVVNGTYEKIGENYPDIKDYLCLSADDIDASALPEEGSGDPNYTFKHGFDLDYPPYSYLKDDGSVGGFDVEMCQAVCEYLGWGYEAVPFNWDAKDMELNAMSCDCIWSGFTKEGREDDYAWGITYSNNTQGILVAGDSDITTLADLSGKIVGVQTATSAYDLLQDSRKELADTFAELKVYETYTIAYNDLKAGAIDAIAIDMTAGSFLIAGDQG
ncbi:MAG: transporter substrate-binding domain-containing protein [Lachnospiraceae bacterium]|nr:transporter substrate-binding domain-containing protein [Lachnospiraceae bacterium]